MSEAAVYAAGAVVWRRLEDKIKILLIHRTQYRDITLPKGKVDPGEMLAETAVREIAEETGITVTLGPPLGVSSYPLSPRKQKIVHYWSAEATDAAIRHSQFVPNNEIAALEWVGLTRARKILSYAVDVEILDTFSSLADEGAIDTFPLVVLRHAKATPRSQWDGADAGRPLTLRGQQQAQGIVGGLRAFGVRRIITSDARRCLETVTPLSLALGRPLRTTPLISQDAWEEGTGDVRAVVGKRVRSRKPAVICSHGPVIPDLVREIALATGTLSGSYISSAADLPTAGFSVVHLSVTHPGSGIISIETHLPKD